ncbi:MAG: DUF4445 domain-containing protein [Syntrophobacterales bacterium]|nr:MAG: DUF4445 domain-containing protein [Syntrophobacterales bacterium]
MKCWVIFQPSGRRGYVDKGKNLLQSSRELGVDIKTLCGEKQTCGKCRVRIEEGSFPSYGIYSKRKNLSPFTSEEGKFIDAEDKRLGYRLSCAARLQGDVVVYVPEESRGEKQVICKAPSDMGIEINPAVKGYDLELNPPSLSDPKADLARLRADLEKRHGLKGLDIDYPILIRLGDTLRTAQWRVTAVIWMDQEIIDIRPGDFKSLYGIAIDIGTTTVAGYLCDLLSGEVLAMDSLMNPQITFGEDIMARITYTTKHPGEGLKRMHEQIIQSINQMIVNTTQLIGASPEEVYEMTIVGNTAMHHFFLGINPEYLGKAPFCPALHQSIDVKARDLGLKIHPSGNIHVLPIEAGFVGADNVGVILAQQPHHLDEETLIIDIGTNGELVMGNKEGLHSASCATGPAFEGAHITFGMRAAPGAIERVRLNPEDDEVSFKVIGVDRWSDQCEPEEIGAKGICGSGIIDTVAEMVKAGIVDKSGRLLGSIPSSRIKRAKKGYEFVLAKVSETAIGRDITITSDDIRQVQLAKGALYAGAKVMMEILGFKKINRVILAGAFGNYIDPEKAMILGLFPDCELQKVTAVGNAAGDGARLALLNKDKRREADDIARRVGYIELTLCKDFADQFASAMHFPHMRDPFPHLRGLIPDEVINLRDG